MRKRPRKRREDTYMTGSSCCILFRAGLCSGIYVLKLNDILLLSFPPNRLAYYAVLQEQHWKSVKQVFL